MGHAAHESIADLLRKSIPLDLVLACHEAAQVGAERAFTAARELAEGHWGAGIGQLRHFHMNETFHGALSVADAAPSPLSGNAIVVGHVGVVTLARINVSHSSWPRIRRSTTRRAMALANAAIEPLVLPGLFPEAVAFERIVVFIVAIFTGARRANAGAPFSIEIAVPDRNLLGWLFHEPLTLFAARYDQPEIQSQPDLAQPTLAKGRARRDDLGETGS